MTYFTFLVDVSFQREYDVKATSFEEAYVKLEELVSDQHIVDAGDAKIADAYVVDEVPDSDVE